MLICWLLLILIGLVVFFHAACLPFIVYKLGAEANSLLNATMITFNDSCNLRLLDYLQQLYSSCLIFLVTSKSFLLHPNNFLLQATSNGLDSNIRLLIGLNFNCKPKIPIWVQTYWQVTTFLIFSFCFHWYIKS